MSRLERALFLAAIAVGSVSIAAMPPVMRTGRRYGREAADTTKAYRHIPLLHVDDIFAAVPFDCVPVAVDLLDGAYELPNYRHPQRAFYIFGPEDGTLGRAVADRCRDKLMIPTRYCMNLAATVNVVLYDRLAKSRALPMQFAQGAP
jgi:tRNA(Leu) C34 or U34 (ribose-2'-O)-methylase TrmL